MWLVLFLNFKFSDRLRTTVMESPSSKLMREDGDAVIHMCPSLSQIADNKDRVNALYSPFRPRETNPAGFDRKLKFWSKVIEEYVSIGGKLSFTLGDLQRDLRINNKTPACLEDVVKHGISEGTIMTMGDFNDHLKSLAGWIAWSQIKVKQSLSKVVPNPLSYFRRDEQFVTYVHLEYLKSISGKCEKEDRFHKGIMSVSKFKEDLREISGVKEDGNVILDYLKAKNCAVTDKIGHEDVLCMGKSSHQPTISQVERGKYDVLRTKELLESRLSEMESKCETAIVNAKKALKDGKRSTAKYELKRKKAMEQRIDKLLNIVDNLTVIVMKIEDAESDAMILSAYEAGKKSLTSALDENNLTPDRVTEAMLDIEEILDQQQEISAAISGPLDTDDTAQLEEELEALLSEGNKVNEVEEKRGKLSDDEEEALKLLSQLNVADSSFPSPNQQDQSDLHSSIASET